MVAAAVGAASRREAVDDRPPLVLRAPGQRAVEHRLGEDEDVPWGRCRLPHVLRQLRVADVRQRGRHWVVGLVAAWHRAETPVPGASVCQLHADGEELGAHLPMPEAILQRPRRLPALRDCPAVQGVALGAQVLSDQKWRMVQAVANSQELSEDGDQPRVAHEPPERLAVWPPPAQHAAHVLPARAPVARQGPGLAAVEARGPEPPRPLVQRPEVRVHGGVGRLHVGLRQR
mmetsp:Transcript_40127/g.115819  ORF Transcript_40127/g.115819 Transcript_40127/m.115819 type:complete len:231 (+) Transcript_40127:254-946(+)